MRWLADENLRGAIVSGLTGRCPDADVTRAQDVPEVAGHDDVTLLAWASRVGRIVLTQDVTTMIPARDIHLASGGHCVPIVIVPDTVSISQAIEDIVLLDQCATESDWEAGILYLPLR